MQKKKHILFIFSGLLLLSIGFFVLVESFFHEQFITFLANNFSSDGSIDSAGSFKFYLYIYVRLMFIFIIIPALCYFNYDNLKKINQSLLKNKTLIITYGVCILLTILWFVSNLQHNMDIYYEGIAEIFSEGILLITIIVFIFNIRMKPRPKSVLVALILLLVFCLFFFLEEISYGQTIFHWTTPENLFLLNRQKETNLHNFFNPYFGWLYPTLSLLLSIAFLYIYKIKESVKNREIRILIPSEQFTYFSFLFIIVGMFNLVYFPDANEILEEILILAFLSYAIELNKYFKEEKSV